MKYLKLFPLLAVVALTSCNLDPGSVYYNNVVIPIDERIIPDTVVVGEPFFIYAHSTLDNDCWSNIRFFFDTIEERNFQIFALADYASIGACSEIPVTADTALTLTADLPGDYLFRIWMNAYEYDLDTLIVKENIEGK
jgi:hypothetical protein